jgi:hypothetical protein
MQQKVDRANLQSTTPLPEFYSTTPKPTTTTFEPCGKNSGETKWQYFQRKEQELSRIFKLMQKEKRMAEESNSDTSVDFYVHNREKRFIQLLKIATDTV